MNLEGAKGVKTPGEDEKAWKEQENAEALKGREATEFRAIAARANYLALDRADIQYAVAGGMASPTKGYLQNLGRLGRYLIEHPRSITHRPFQRAGGYLGVLGLSVGWV